MRLLRQSDEAGVVGYDDHDSGQESRMTKACRAIDRWTKQGKPDIYMDHWLQPCIYRWLVIRRAMNKGYNLVRPVSTSKK